MGIIMMARKKPLQSGEGGSQKMEMEARKAQKEVIELVSEAMKHVVVAQKALSRARIIHGGGYYSPFWELGENWDDLERVWGNLYRIIRRERALPKDHKEPF